MEKWRKICLQATAFTSGGLITFLFLSTFINALSYRSFRPIILPIPNAESIGRNYLQAVMQKQPSYPCSDDESMIKQFGGAQTRNISVNAKWQSGNSDHEFEITTIKFEYRHQSNNPWQKGEIQLMTVSNSEGRRSWQDNLPFRRLICGLV